MANDPKMVSDPSFAAAVKTPSGKPAGGAPADPVTLYIRKAEGETYDVLDSTRAVIKAGTTEPLVDAVAHLKAANLDPFTLVSVREDTCGERVLNGNLKDL
jgi:hypothetical protein